jgi:hypothetical protein
MSENEKQWRAEDDIRTVERMGDIQADPNRVIAMEQELQRQEAAVEATRQNVKAVTKTGPANVPTYPYRGKV